MRLQRFEERDKEERIKRREKELMDSLKQEEVLILVFIFSDPCLYISYLVFNYPEESQSIGDCLPFLCKDCFCLKI